MLKLAIIDTGYNKTTSSKLKLCKEGHKDLTGWDNPFEDKYGHGTHIANIIGDSVTTDYCAIIIKFINSNDKYDQQHTGERIVQAFNYLAEQHVDIVNFSGGGNTSNSKEEQALRKLVNQGVNVFVAAGNESADLDEVCDFFPACYALKINVVGNLLDKDTVNPSSNYGKYVVTEWQIGSKIKEEVSERIYMSLSGTSQASAVASAKWMNKK